MREAERSFFPGLEFYRTPGMGLVAIENNAAGKQGSYTGLTDEEARAWLDAWLKGERYSRFGDPDQELVIP